MPHVDISADSGRVPRSELLIGSDRTGRNNTWGDTRRFVPPPYNDTIRASIRDPDLIESDPLLSQASPDEAAAVTTDAFAEVRGS